MKGKPVAMTRRDCIQCKNPFDVSEDDNEKFCSEDCEDEYEPDVCDECNEELDPDWEHECPMVACEVNPAHGEYNENQEHDGCPECADADDDEEEEGEEGDTSDEIEYDECPGCNTLSVPVGGGACITCPDDE